MTDTVGEQPKGRYVSVKLLLPVNSFEVINGDNKHFHWFISPVGHNTTFTLLLASRIDNNITVIYIGINLINRS